MSRPTFLDFIKKNSQGATLALLLLASSLSILFSGTSFIRFPTQFGISVVSAIQVVFTGIGGFFTDTFHSIQKLRELQEKFDSLNERLELYRGLERTLVELQQENRELRNQLGFKEQFTHRLIPAQVVAKDPSNVSRTIMINKGYLDGVRPDAPVIAYQGDKYGLVGRVLEVGFTGAQIQTITDPGNYVASRFVNSRFEGMTVGMGGHSDIVRLLYVRKRALDEIRFGDLVATSGNSSLYPRGIHIGRVSQISSRDYENTLEIDLEPVVDFNRLEYVFILEMNGEASR